MRKNVSGKNISYSLYVTLSCKCVVELVRVFVSLPVRVYTWKSLKPRPRPTLCIFVSRTRSYTPAYSIASQLHIKTSTVSNTVRISMSRALLLTSFILPIECYTSVVFIDFLSLISFLTRVASPSTYFVRSFIFRFLLSHSLSLAFHILSNISHTFTIVRFT